MFQPIWIPEGFRFFRRRIKVGIKGYNRYPGDALEIAEAIIEDCWNGAYYQTSTGNFNQFYSRDFGMCTPALLRLANHGQVRQTLKWALEVFRKAGRITVCITPGGVPYDFPSIAPDFLAFFSQALSHLDDKSLIEDARPFLQQEAERLHKVAVDKKTGLPRQGVHLTGMRDHAVRNASCYDTCMLGMIKENLDDMEVSHPFDFDYSALLDEHYWNGEYFLDDLSGYQGFTGDANLMPFYTGLVRNKDRFRKVQHRMEEDRLNKPLPLRYFNRKTKEHRMFWTELLAPSWEMDTVWGHLGMLYLETLIDYDPGLLRKGLRQWKERIEHDGTFIEVHHPDGRPYRSLFYAADEGMLWASLFLALWRDHGT